MPAYIEPPKTQQKVFNTDEISRRADPEWGKDRNYLPAYKFTGHTFIDHRDRVYDPVEVWMIHLLSAGQQGYK